MVVVREMVRVVVFKRRCGTEDCMPGGDDRDGDKKSNSGDGGEGSEGGGV